MENKNLSKDWVYDKDIDTYVFGTRENGGGVFEQDGKWHGNVVKENIVLIGPCNSMEEAQKAVEEEYECTG